MHFNRLFEVIFNTLFIVQFALATPYSWSSHHSNYDASLDPIVWSRSFVKDSIRRPRQYRTNSLDDNSLDGGEDEFPLQGYGYGGFGKRRSSRVNFGNDYAAAANNWYNNNPSSFGYNGKFNNNNHMQKRMNRRRQKLNARHRYGLV